MGNVFRCFPHLPRVMSSRLQLSPWINAAFFRFIWHVRHTFLIRTATTKPFNVALSQPHLHFVDLALHFFTQLFRYPKFFFTYRLLLGLCASSPYYGRFYH